MYYFIDVCFGKKKVPKVFSTDVLYRINMAPKHMPILWVWSLFIYSVNTLKSDRRVTLSNPICPGAKTCSKQSLLCPVVPSKCFLASPHICGQTYINWSGTACEVWIQSQQIKGLIWTVHPSDHRKTQWEY